MEKEFETLLGNIYLLYFKAKISLGEAHLIGNPKGYLKRFDLRMPFKCDLDILDYLVSVRTSTYSTLCNNWLRCHSSLTGRTPIQVINALSNKTPLWEEVDDMYDPSRERVRDQNYWVDCQLNKWNDVCKSHTLAYLK